MHLQADNVNKGSNKSEPTLQLAVTGIFVGFCAGVSVSAGWQTLIRNGLPHSLPYLGLTLFLVLIAASCAKKLVRTPAAHLPAIPEGGTITEEEQTAIYEEDRTSTEEEGVTIRCCFCGRNATPPLCELALKNFTIGEWQTSQNTWCHVQCLKEHLHAESKSLLD